GDDARVEMRALAVKKEISRVASTGFLMTHSCKTSGGFPRRFAQSRRNSSARKGKSPAAPRRAPFPSAWSDLGHVAVVAPGRRVVHVSPGGAHVGDDQPHGLVMTRLDVAQRPGLELTRVIPLLQHGHVDGLLGP